MTVVVVEPGGPVTIVQEHPVVPVQISQPTVIVEVTGDVVVVEPPPVVALQSSTVVAVVTAPERVVVIDPRIPGLPGADGTGAGTDAIVLTRTAAVALSGHRVVAPRPDGTVEYASNDILGDATRPLWLTLGAAAQGDDVQLLAFGEVTEPSWNWTAGMPVFLGADGILTQAVPIAPAAAFLVQLAAGRSGPITLFYDPKIPFGLN